MVFILSMVCISEWARVSPCILTYFRGPLRRQVNVDRHFPGCNGTSASDDTKFLPEAARNQTCGEDARFTYIDCEVNSFVLFIR